MWGGHLFHNCESVMLGRAEMHRARCKDTHTGTCLAELDRITVQTGSILESDKTPFHKRSLQYSTSTTA